jgi:hypothetical protein
MSELSSALAHVQTLSALLSMADIAVGEAALSLADRIDEKTDADANLRTRREAVQALHALHERLSRPGQALQPELMGQIARQAPQLMSAAREAEHRCQDADAQVDEQRAILQALQARHDMVQDLHRQAREQLRAEREAREAIAREELYLAHRWSAKERAWT